MGSKWIVIRSAPAALNLRRSFLHVGLANAANRILHRRILYRATSVVAIAVCFWSVKTYGQEQAPEIMPSERRTAKKKDPGPRALAILRLGSSGKSTLVPIEILINGKFWDSSVYKADPVPMALDPGTVYEAERTGNSLGLFTVNTALHSNAVNVPEPWIATGAWHPAGAEPTTKVLKAESAPVGLEPDDGPPRLTRPGAATSSSASKDAGKETPPAGNPPSSGTAPSSASSPTSSSTSSSKPADDSDDDRPHLKRGTDTSDTPASTTSTAPTSSTPSSTTSSSSAPSGASKPTDAKGDTKSTAKSDTRAHIPASDSGTAEADRPILRRGKPAESFADEVQDVPGYSRPGVTPSATIAAVGKGTEASTKKEEFQLIPAISDAAGPVPHSFNYEWIKGDEDDRRKQMTDLAKVQLRLYLQALSHAEISPKKTNTAAHHAAAKAPEPVFDDVHMSAFDLWGSNQPVIVWSATARMPAHATSESTQNPDLQYSILLVAYPDIYNNIHKIYSAVTDKYHLDVTPRFELVDAVDVDGDGRGELLFKETSDAGAGWIIYRASADKLSKLYDSLNPE